MQYYTKKLVFARVLCRFIGILPTLFWILLIFGFEEGPAALSTIICAMIHELGHLAYLLTKNKDVKRVFGALNGMRISAGNQLTYREEMALYLSGPISNLIVGVFCILLGFFFGEFAFFFAYINFATAISNLIPIEGYDGYGALKAYIVQKEERTSYLIPLSYVSTLLIFLLCILSLYLIDRYSGGYWIFAIFFFSMIKYIKSRLG